MENEVKLHKLLSEKALTLSIAESCTGGALSKRFTQLPGSSIYFLGSVIAYSNSSKEILLDVPAQWIIEEGAVSEKVACAMAQGIQKKLQSAYALATTGIAGPSGGTPQKPVGTVWIALATPQAVKAWRLQLKGGRNDIIEATCDELLQRFWQGITGD